LDGGTIEIGLDQKRVRLVGFSAPETNGAACERELNRSITLQRFTRTDPVVSANQAAN
jgi:hypothetical protein